MNWNGCGFCHRGVGVRGECGKLYRATFKSRVVAAHKRCMQYSANLGQYDFRHFGGFEVDEVNEEYKRGCQLRCHLCKDTKKSNKSRVNLRSRGATAGCALPRCQRTFHYYCAREDGSVITKKLQEPDTEGDKNIEKFMVFCDSNHEYEFRNKNPGLESCEESSDNDCDSEGSRYSEQSDDRVSHDDDKNDEDDMEEETDVTDGIDLINDRFGDNGGDENGDLQGCSDNNASEEEKNKGPLNGHADNSSDSDEDERPRRKCRRIRTTSTRNQSKIRSEICSKNGHNEKRRQSDDNADEKLEERHSLYKKKKSNVTNGHKSEHVSPVNNGFSLTPSTSMAARQGRSRQDRNKRPSLHRRLPACAVCISESPPADPGMSIRIKDAIRQQCDILWQHIFIWQDLDHTRCLLEHNTLAFMKDLVAKVIDENVSEVEKLLFDHNYLRELDKAKYQPQAEILQFLDGDSMRRVWSTIQSSSENSDSIKGVIKVDSKQNLVLLLNNTGIDREGKLREKLGVTEDGFMVKWPPNATVINGTGDEITDTNDPEMDTILAWIEENISVISNVYVHPTEEILTAMSKGGSVTEEIASRLMESKTNNKQTIMVFKQVDEEVVNFKPYCRKAVKKVIFSCIRTGCKLSVLIDIRSLDKQDIQQQVQHIFQDDDGAPLPVTIRSAFEPSINPVSCVLVEVHIDQFTDEMQCVNEANKEKVRGKYVNDGQVPSTSGTSELMPQRRGSPRGGNS